MCKTVFESSPSSAAEAVAAALAEGIDPSDVGEAIALAANQLVLRDAGRPERWASPGKPPGSVHGDSVGVHASDAVNAWRNMSRVVNPRNAAACLILAGYEVARDRQARAADFLKWTPRPLAEVLDAVKTTDSEGPAGRDRIRDPVEPAGDRLRAGAPLRHARPRPRAGVRAAAEVRRERGRRTARREVLQHGPRGIHLDPPRLPLEAARRPGPRDRQRVRPPRAGISRGV